MQLRNSGQEDEECDATDDDSSPAVGLTKNINKHNQSVYSIKNLLDRFLIVVTNYTNVTNISLIRVISAISGQPLLFKWVYRIIKIPLPI
jgi:hypothetical protein